MIAEHTVQRHINTLPIPLAEREKLLADCRVILNHIKRVPKQACRHLTVATFTRYNLTRPDANEALTILTDTAILTKRFEWFEDDQFQAIDIAVELVAKSLDAQEFYNPVTGETITFDEFSRRCFPYWTLPDID